MDLLPQVRKMIIAQLWNDYLANVPEARIASTLFPGGRPTLDHLAIETMLVSPLETRKKRHRAERGKALRHSGELARIVLNS